jgi:hypothetical protein
MSTREKKTITATLPPGESAIARDEYLTLEELLDDLSHDRRTGGVKKPQAIC